jgi:hypothetical protein
MMGDRVDKGAEGPDSTPKSLIFPVLNGKIDEKPWRSAVGYNNCFCTRSEEKTSHQGRRFEMHKVTHASDIFLAVDFRSDSTR